MIVAGIGRLTKDPDLRYLKNEQSTAAVSFTVAVDDRFKKDHTNFFACKAYSKVADTIGKYFAKGHRIYIEGELRQERWEKNDMKYSMVSITVTNFNFVEKKSDTSKPQDNASFVDDGEEDTPF